ncbi:MAG: tRNA (adenosine(37)-N6)-threonylcarbamoyltransferase complex dimerization subunit type 1 TsaB [Ignavibacteria bacterium]|nr:tRNA (adenosine(37)-N6)-threonylcarbamoyltransferase complex dimerization subunit type 1 TsaB [Ignavibacteria bacterium]
MIILGIESTSLVCGSAVVRSGEIIAINEIKEANVHDLYLTGSVRNVLKDAGISFDDIDVVAVSSGPGSFTGTRIGVSFAKGLTLTNRPQLLGISTMESLVYAYSSSLTQQDRFPLTVACILESHGNRCFLQRFNVTSRMQWEALSVIDIVTVSEIQTTVDARDVLVSPTLSEPIMPAKVVCIELSAAYVAMCAYVMIDSKRQKNVDPLTFEPTYRQEFVGKRLP